MPDVSCLMTEGLLNFCDEVGLGSTYLVEGLGKADQKLYSIEHLKNPCERIPWKIFQHFLSRISKAYPAEDFIGHLLSCPTCKCANWINKIRGPFGSFRSPLWLYQRLLTSNYQSHLSPLLLSIEESSSDTLDLKIKFTKPHEGDSSLLEIQKIILANVPTLIGYPAAKVESQYGKGVAAFKIKLPDFRPTLRQRFSHLQSLISFPKFRDLVGRRSQVEGSTKDASSKAQSCSGNVEPMDPTDVLCKLEGGQGKVRPSANFQKQKGPDQGSFNQRSSYGRVINALEAALMVVDPQGQIVEVNDAFCGYLKCERATLVGTLVTHLSRPEVVQVIDPLLDEVGSSKIGVSRDCEFEVSSSSTLWLRWTASPLLDSQGEISSFAVTAFDITDVKRGQQELRASKEQADLANRAKSAFLANISHEIRTPMSSVLGFTELLNRPDIEESQRQHYLEVIYRNGMHLMTLINDVIDLARVESGRISLETTKLSVREEIRESLDILEPLARAKNLHLKTNVAKSVPDELFSDSTRVRQIMINIVGNAIKFTRQGVVTIGVSIGDNGRLIIDITDQGCGISSEQSARLFQPFSQADPSTTREYGGSGLGLALSRRLARALGGELSLLDSVPDQGSTFRINLPYSNESSGSKVPADRLSPAGPGVNDPVDLQGRKLVLVEDRPDVRFVYSTMLIEAGARVQCYEDGRDALQSLKSKPNSFDLILLDMQMPQLDGFAATRQLRELGCEVPILALTSFARDEERQRCLAVGCNDHIAKPVDRRRLLSTVSHWLN